MHAASSLRLGRSGANQARKPRINRDLSEARPAGIEPATLGLEVPCSIRLSYGRMKVKRSLGASIGMTYKRA